ncbi:hypothetical protein GCM10009733_064900 [Nonomuraea maheshkhaliensis]|uniref:Uncharacterized protein n=1 Tax=Nonomuraea maheshkhaliensis TaxID=419590 RepID=A0ABP4RQZ7_9ACTN
MDLTSYAEWAVRLANDPEPPPELRRLRDELAGVFDAAGDDRAVAGLLNALSRAIPYAPSSPTTTAPGTCTWPTTRPRPP